MNHDAKSVIKTFVRETLGCQCADEVFSAIQYSHPVGMPFCSAEIARVVIGDRLLLYILETDSPSIIEHDLPLLLAQGKQERDRHGYNRLRLVLVTTVPLAAQMLAETVFNAQTIRDDRVHLHVTGPRAVYDMPWRT